VPHLTWDTLYVILKSAVVSKRYWFALENSCKLSRPRAVRGVLEWFRGTAQVVDKSAALRVLSRRSGLGRRERNREDYVLNFIQFSKAPLITSVENWENGDRMGLKWAGVLLGLRSMIWTSLNPNLQCLNAPIFVHIVIFISDQISIERIENNWEHRFKKLSVDWKVKIWEVVIKMTVQRR
jgi:hypothetical protein